MGKDRFSRYIQKGNQIKYVKNDRLIKLDRLGYEGLSEALAYEVALFTNTEDPLEYETGRFEFNGKIYNGCSSKNFLCNGDEYVSYWDIMRTINIDYSSLFNELSTEELIEYVLSVMKSTTGIDSRIWLGKLIEFDYFTLNDDRHMKNIGFIYNANENKFKHMPIFDNGASFLSDIVEYPTYEKVQFNERNVSSKPFSEDRERQLKAVWEVCGRNLEIDLEGIRNIPLYQFRGYHREIINRVNTVLLRSVERWRRLEKKNINNKLLF